jgi:hypothetical protein
MSEASAHQRRIDAIMAKAYRREGHNFAPKTAPTPLDALLAAEEQLPDDEQRIRSEAISGFILWLFEESPHPAPVMKKLYAFVRMVRPETLWNMPGTDIAAIFGQGRAAESARCNLLLEKLKLKAGYKNLSMPFQKSATAKQKYAEAQRGNKHRANSIRGNPAPDALRIPVSGKAQRGVAA